MWSVELSAGMAAWDGRLWSPHEAGVDAASASTTGMDGPPTRLWEMKLDPSPAQLGSVGRRFWRMDDGR